MTETPGVDLLRRPERIPAIAVVGVALLLVTGVYLATSVIPDGGGYTYYDGRFYAAMADSDLFPEPLRRIAPYCHRVLTPYLVSLLPLPTLQSFLLLAFLSNCLALLVLFLVLRQLGFSDRLSLFGLGLYGGVFWSLRFSFFAPTYIDFQTQLFLLLVVHLTLARRWLWLIPVLFLAALQKESLAAYSLFAVTALLRDGAPRAPLIGLALVLAPLSAIALVRFAIEPLNEYGPGVALTHLGWLAQPAFWPVLCQALFSGLGLIGPLLLVHYGPWLEFLRRSPAWIVYLVLSGAMLFGGVDKARLFLYALPLAVILALHVVRVLAESAPPRRLLVWGFAFSAAHGYVGGYASSLSPTSEYLAMLVPVHSGGSFLPYLLRNLLLALCAIGVTIPLCFGTFRFQPLRGFVPSGRQA